MAALMVCRICDAGRTGRGERLGTREGRSISSGSSAADLREVAQRLAQPRDQRGYQAIRLKRRSSWLPVGFLAQKQSTDCFCTVR